MSAHPASSSGSAAIGVQQQQPQQHYQQQPQHEQLQQSAVDLFAAFRGGQLPPAQPLELSSLFDFVGAPSTPSAAQAAASGLLMESLTVPTPFLGSPASPEVKLEDVGKTVGSQD